MCSTLPFFKIASHFLLSCWFGELLYRFLSSIWEGGSIFLGKRKRFFHSSMIMLTPSNFPADGTLLGNKVIQGVCAEIAAYTALGKDTTGALHLFCRVLLCKWQLKVSFKKCSVCEWCVLIKEQWDMPVCRARFVGAGVLLEVIWSLGMCRRNGNQVGGQVTVMRGFFSFVKRCWQLRLLWGARLGARWTYSWETTWVVFLKPPTTPLSPLRWEATPCLATCGSGYYL